MRKICVTITIRFDVDEETYEWLREHRDRRGYTWKGLMLEGAKELTGDRPPSEQDSGEGADSGE